MSDKKGNDLEQFRSRIDILDKQIIDSLAARIEVVKKVGEYKKENNIEPLDTSRWQQVLDKIGKHSEKLGIKKELVHKIYEMVHEYSLEIEGAEKVYYLGPEGSYSHLAVKKLFPITKYLHFPKESFSEIRDTVLNGGDNVIGVLPIENSITSNIHENVDTLYSQNFKIISEGYLNIKLNLIVYPGTKLGDIKKVISHPKALEQCTNFININSLHPITAQSTSEAIKQISTLKSHEIAAIGSIEGAKEAGLQILEEDIGNQKNNQTRFIAVKKLNSNEEVKIKDGENKVSLIFNAKHEVGSLAKILIKISDDGGNLTKIESRPIPGTDWIYNFLIEIEAEELIPILNSIHKLSENCVIIGSYRRGNQY